MLLRCVCGSNYKPIAHGSIQHALAQHWSVHGLGPCGGASLQLAIFGVLWLQAVFRHFGQAVSKQRQWLPVYWLKDGPAKNKKLRKIAKANARSQQLKAAKPLDTFDTDDENDNSDAEEPIENSTNGPDQVAEIEDSNFGNQDTQDSMDDNSDFEMLGVRFGARELCSGPPSKAISFGAAMPAGGPPDTLDLDTQPDEQIPGTPAGKGSMVVDEDLHPPQTLNSTLIKMYVFFWSRHIAQDCETSNSSIHPALWWLDVLVWRPSMTHPIQCC